MSVKKLILDDFFEEEAFGLIGIMCNLEDYQLAYIINSVFQINLKREPEDLDFLSSKSSYSIYEYNDTTNQTLYNLASNISKVDIEHQGDSNSLFSAPTKSTKTYYLVPEYKRVNYILKITNDTIYNKQKRFIKLLLDVPQIVTAYSLNIETIKHKDHLIF